MFKNYFIVAFRNIWRNKGFSVINVLSLSIGISAALVIYLIVDYEFSFERFQKGGDRVYRVVSNLITSDKSYPNPGVPFPMRDAVQKEIAGLDAVIPFSTWTDGTKITVPLAYSAQPLIFKNQKKIAFVDGSYFDLLQYKWLTGTAATSLLHPYNVVLTESVARLYFPGIDIASVIGREIYFNDSIQTTVTGVVKDLVQHTDFTFNVFISKVTSELPRLRPYEWNDWNSTTASSQLFVRLSDGTRPEQISGQVNHLFDKYHRSDPGDINRTTHMLQPLSDIHFNRDFDNFGQRVAHKPTLYGLLAIAVFLLMLGCINFINLSTARASRRAKEIGVRKTMGSSRKQLLSQFLGETFFLTLIATLLSLIISPLLLKAFADFIPEGLHLSMIFQFHILLFLLVVILVISIVSGAYPAFVLSSFNPVTVLKNQGHPNSRRPAGTWLRKSLTVCQFVIAQVFIIATIVVSKQINYSLHQHLGFRKDAVLYFHVPFSDTDAGNKLVLLNKLRSIPEVSTVSLSNNPPSAKNNRSSMMKYKGANGEIEANVDVKFGDTSFIRLYGMKMLAGTNVPYSDTVNSLIINETYAHVLGFRQPGQAIGEFIEWDNKKVPVVGVVADFHQKSVHELIRPLAIASSDQQQIFFNVALRQKGAGGTTWKNALAKIENAWKEVYPKYDFDYAFLDDTIAGYYKSERDISRLLGWATGLSIVISYLGLIGLVTYITSQRRKEIGIRKIVGATIRQIVLLLLKEFLVLIVIASAIAIPVSWWSAGEWLQNFAYRTGISWWMFMAGVFVILITTFITLGGQILKAANVNPVKSIRTE